MGYRIRSIHGATDGDVPAMGSIEGRQRVAARVGGMPCRGTVHDPARRRAAGSRRAGAVATHTELRPYTAEGDRRGEFHERSHQKIHEAGLVGLTVTEEHGPRSRGVFEACPLLVELAAGCMASAMTLQMNLNGPPRVVGQIVREAERRRYLAGAAMTRSSA